MKVLFINSVYGCGSTGRIVKELGQAVEKNNWEYKVAYGRGKKVNDSHCYYIGNKFSVYLHALLSRITDKTGFYSKCATRKLIKFIRSYSPDIIHLHNLHGYYLNVEILFKYLKQEFKGKVVWTLHDCWAFTGHCVHYTYAKCNKWQTQCHNCVEKKRYPAALLKDNTLVNYQEKKRVFLGVPNLTIVAPSLWLKNQIEKSFLSTYNTTVINNGIDLSFFYTADYKKENLILNVSDGIDERKGFYDLIKLRNYLPEKYKLVIVGTKKRISIPGIEIIPFLKHEDLITYYQKAKFFVNPTYEDTFPSVNLEALACGTPVITYNAGGAIEMITDETGVILMCGDVEGIAHVIEEKTFSSSICRGSIKKYDKIKKYNEYLTLYSCLIDKESAI